MRKALRETQIDFVQEMILWDIPSRYFALQCAIKLKEAAIHLGFTKTQAKIMSLQTVLGTFALLRHENTLSS